MERSNVDENAWIDALSHVPAPRLSCAVADHDDLTRLRGLWRARDAYPRFLVNRDAGTDASWGDVDIRTLLGGDESAGRLSYHDVLLPPGAAFPVHYLLDVHAYWWVVEGEVDLRVGDLTARVERLGVGYAPPATRLGVSNPTGAPARLYVAHGPAGIERAFEEVHALLVADPTTKPEVYQAILGKYGFRFDDALLANDSIVNDPPARIVKRVETATDFEALRATWRAARPIPFLAQHEPPSAHTRMDGVNGKLMFSGDQTAGHATSRLTWVGAQHGVPPHHQPSEEEAFYVVDGEIEIACGAAVQTVGPGAFGFAPRNATHRFFNHGDARARFITMNAPAGHERGFEMMEQEWGSDKLPDLMFAHGWRMHTKMTTS